MANKTFINKIHAGYSGNSVTAAYVDDLVSWQGSETEELRERIEKIEARLAILETPSEEKLEQFPALRDAYEHYLLVEKLVDGET